MKRVSCMSIKLDKYDLVPTEKAQNITFFVFKTHFIQCLLSEVDVKINSNNKTYTAIAPPNKKKP